MENLGEIIEKKLEKACFDCKSQFGVLDEVACVVALFKLIFEQCVLDETCSQELCFNVGLSVVSQPDDMLHSQLVAEQVVNFNLDLLNSLHSVRTYRHQLKRVFRSLVKRKHEVHFVTRQEFVFDFLCYHFLNVVDFECLLEIVRRNN